MSSNLPKPKDQNKLINYQSINVKHILAAFSYTEDAANFIVSDSLGDVGTIITNSSMKGKGVVVVNELKDPTFTIISNENKFSYNSPIHQYTTSMTGELKITDHIGGKFQDFLREKVAKVLDVSETHLIFVLVSFIYGSNGDCNPELIKIRPLIFHMVTLNNSFSSVMSHNIYSLLYVVDYNTYALLPNYTKLYQITISNRDNASENVNYNRSTTNYTNNNNGPPPDTTLSGPCNLPSQLPIDGYSGQQLAARVAYNAGFRGSSWVIATSISGAESAYVPTKIGDIGLETTTQGPSYGLWQILTFKPVPESYPDSLRIPARLTDPSYNASVAYAVSQKGTDFTPWSTYNDGSYYPFVNSSKQVIKNICASYQNIQTVADPLFASSTISTTNSPTTSNTTYTSLQKQLSLVAQFNNNQSPISPSVEEANTELLSSTSTSFNNLNNNNLNILDLTTSKENNLNETYRNKRLNYSKPMKTLNELFGGLDFELKNQVLPNKANLQDLLGLIRNNYDPKIKPPIQEKDNGELPLVYNVALDPEYENYPIDNRNLPFEQFFQEQHNYGITSYTPPPGSHLPDVITEMMRMSSKVGEDAGQNLPTTFKMNFNTIKSSDNKYNFYINVKKYTVPYNLPDGTDTGPGTWVIKPLEFNFYKDSQSEEIVFMNSHFLSDFGLTTMEKIPNEMASKVVLGNREQITVERIPQLGFFQSGYSGIRVMSRPQSYGLERPDLDVNLDNLTYTNLTQTSTLTLEIIGNPDFLSDIYRNPQKVYKNDPDSPTFYKFPEYYPMYAKLNIFLREVDENTPRNGNLPSTYYYTGYYHLGVVGTLMRGNAFIQTLELYRRDNIV